MRRTFPQIESIDAITCEDCLELVAGVSQLKYTGIPEFQDLHSFKLHPDNHRIMFSIAKQVFRGVALTSKQHKLVKHLLLEYYQEQFDIHDIDLRNHVDQLRNPHREIDSSHWIKIQTSKHPKKREEEEMLVIRFPFNKKVIDRIDELKNSSDKDYFYHEHKHYFPITEKYVYRLVNIANKFAEKFDIDDAVMEIYNKLIEFENNKHDYIPGIYNNEVKNLPQKAVDNILEDLGSPSNETLYKFYDRRRMYGLEHFDQGIVSDNFRYLNDLTKKLIDRAGRNVCVNSTTWSLDALVESLTELDRFPLLVLLDEHTALDNLIELHSRLTHIIPAKEMSVMFRLDNGKEGVNEFNQFVKAKGLNNYVDKSTKVVYASSNKISKPLVRSDWDPVCVFHYTRESIRGNIDSWLQGKDLYLQYDADTLNRHGRISETVDLI